MNSPSDRPRTPGIVLAALAVVILVLVAVIALTVKTPPPPTIAEFAPQAVENITNAPTDQAAKAGVGGTCADGQACSTVSNAPPVSTPQVIDVPRVRKCVGDPPRQIEDPQSPPCVPYWAGDNGGATSTGVTRDGIRVAIAEAEGSEAPGGGEATVQTYSAFFNKRFEFYGRKIIPLLYTPTAQQIPQMLAEAGTIADKQVFADIAYQGGAGKDLGGRDYYFYDELARRKVISIESRNSGPPLSDQAHLASFAPYEWTFLAATDDITSNLGGFACASLAGKAPAYASPPTNAASKRIFGVIRQRQSDGTPPIVTDPLWATLRGCGESKQEVTYTAGDDASYENAVLQMKNANVTTIFALGHRGPVNTSLMPRATAQVWFPEWIVSNFISQDDDADLSTIPPEQLRGVFGIRSLNKSLPLGESPWVWARREIEPGWSPANPFKFGFTYWNMLVLASGIQMAGPRLTPAAFGNALHNTKFPNPGCGAPPLFQGCVGFAGGNHTMIDDFAVIWANPNERSEEVETGRGAYCYGHQGARYRLGAWPPDPGLFQDPCR